MNRKEISMNFEIMEKKSELIGSIGIIFAIFIGILTISRTTCQNKDVTSNFTSDMRDITSDMKIIVNNSNANSNALAEKLDGIVVIGNR